MALQKQTNRSSACTQLSPSPILLPTKLARSQQRSLRIPTNFSAFLGIAAAMLMAPFLHVVRDAFNCISFVSSYLLVCIFLSILFYFPVVCLLLSVFVYLSLIICLFIFYYNFFFLWQFTTNLFFVCSLQCVLYRIRERAGAHRR